MKMDIRKAKVSDAEEIVSLRKDSFEKINGEKYPQEQIDILRKKNTSERIIKKMNEREMFCLIEDDKIIGTVDLKEDGEIGGVFVRYDLARRGIGTKLMKLIEDYAKEKGIFEVKLRAAEKALGFYEKLGYGNKGKIKSDSGGINFLMEKNLK